MRTFRTEILDDAEAIRNAQIDLREKLSLNENPESDILNHPLNDYTKCIPLLDMEALTKLLDRDVAIWTKRETEPTIEVGNSKDSGFFKLLAKRKQLLDMCTRRS